MSNANLSTAASRTSAAVSEDGVMRYPLFEMFSTLQGEGFHAGRAAIFVRLGGCDVLCPWCDTAEAQTTGNCEWLAADEIAARASGAGITTAIITGGEPLLWNMDSLTQALHNCGMSVFLETSGTHELSGEFDWVCLSPKRFAPPLEEAFASASELKVVAGSEADLEYAAECASKVGDECRLSLQPEWNRRSSAVPMIVEYIKRHPEWRLSLQMHKFIDIP